MIMFFFRAKYVAPGPPSEVRVSAFGEYILVTWRSPEEPNGVIKKYQVGSAVYSGSQHKDVHVAMKDVEPHVFSELLSNLKPRTNYVVELRARTSNRWGTSVRQTTKTLNLSRKW